MEENKVAQMTKQTDSSRSTDSGVSGNAQTGAREIRDEAQRVAKNISDACVYGDWFDLPAVTLMVDEAITSECSRLASRVEELEKMIAKHSGSLSGTDSAARITSDPATKEIRRSK